MESTFSNHYSPHLKVNYNTNFDQNSSCLANKEQFIPPPNHSFNNQQFQPRIEPRMAFSRNQTNLPQSNNQRSHLKPTSRLISIAHNQADNYHSNTNPNGLHQSNSSHHSTNSHLTTNTIKSTNLKNLNGKREIPRLPNATSRPATSQTCSLNSSTTSTTYSTVQQKNSLQSPNFGKLREKFGMILIVLLPLNMKGT